MNAKSTECYTIDPNARCLRVEISATHSFLLALDYFVFSELTSDDTEQSLRLVFVSHEVVIHGHTLRRIETAAHRMELSTVMKLSEKYESLIGENQPKIREIIVTESKASDEAKTALN